MATDQQRQVLIRILETEKIAYLGKDHCSHTIADPGDRHDRGRTVVHNLFDDGLNFFDLFG